MYILEPGPPTKAFTYLQVVSVSAQCCHDRLHPRAMELPYSPTRHWWYK